MNKSLSVTLIAAAALAASAPAASAQTREFEGTVVSVDRESRTFKLRDSERGTVRVRVTRRTRFERIAGFRGLRAGQRNVETIVRRSNGRWVALEVERSGGGGDHGGSDDDRGRGRGSDDGPGDDHGGRRRGRDH
jgi:hypothetical protein